MTDFEKFIKQFNDHVRQIIKHDDPDVLYLGYYEFGPCKVYSEVYKDDIYEFTEFATRAVIDELLEISFIDIKNDPAIGTFAFSPILANNFLGIKCFFETQYYINNFCSIEVETDFAIHPAAIYECMRRIIIKYEQQIDRKYSQNINDKLNKVIIAIKVFESWARMEEIAIEENFFNKNQHILNGTPDANEFPIKHIGITNSFFANEDFSEVLYNEKVFKFSQMLANAIKYMYDEQIQKNKKKIPSCKILDHISTEQQYLSHVFKGHPAWKSLIKKKSHLEYYLDIS